MALTAYDGLDLREINQNPPSKTYQMNWSTGRILGIVDELDSVDQFIKKALSTERLMYIIYTDAYGREFQELLSGEFPEDLITIELSRLIKEALIYDDRIVEVKNFRFQFQGKDILVNFDVTTIFGDLAIYNKI